MRASDREVPVHAVTASPGSRLTTMARETLVLPADGEVFPLGTLFESALFAFLDSTVLALREELGVSVDQMSERHALG